MRWMVNPPDAGSVVLSNYSKSSLGRYLDDILFQLLVKAMTALRSSEIFYYDIPDFLCV